MKYSEKAINVLTALKYKGVGKAWIVKKLNDNIKEDVIVSLLNKDTKESFNITLEDFLRKKSAIKNDINKLETLIDGVVAIGDEKFPQYRGKVINSQQPVVLFYRGNLSLLESTNKNVAVIGLLTPDKNTEKIEKKVVTELVINGATIVSGLALGCDTIAHRQTLCLNGKTVAILPSPLNNILPASNQALANEIINKNGLIISEYLTDAKSPMELSGRYQERDRLQALFSDSIILVASYAKNDKGNDSGSRLAMNYALNYSIHRCVIYNHDTDANNPKYDLNRQYIKEQENITIINNNNIKEVAQYMISKQPFIAKQQQIQGKLFD
jgi:DNA processing protein